jgi:hypothetical protein
MPNVTEGVEMGQAARIWSLPDDDIGGAFVRRGFNCGGEYLKAGTMLSADQVRSIRMVNRRALSVSGALDIYPVAPALAETADFDRYVIHRGGGHYDVIAGRKLNDDPLSKADAEALAAT